MVSLLGPLVSAVHGLLQQQQRRTTTLVPTAQCLQESPETLRLRQEARETLDTVWSLLHASAGWSPEKRTADGALIESRRIGKHKKVYRLSCTLNIAAREILDEMFYRVENAPEWNPTIIQSSRLQVLDEQTDVVRQVSAARVGGLVSSREFVCLRRWEEREGVHVLAAVSIQHPEAPHDTKLVRGHNGPSCWALREDSARPSERCTFQWLMDTDPRGWLPHSVVDAALGSAMLDLLSGVKTLCSNLKSRSAAS